MSARGAAERTPAGPSERMARAEHELRGAATALALACEAIRRDPAAAGHAAVIDAQLDRLRAGLADLAAARGPDRRAAPRGSDRGSGRGGGERARGGRAERVELSALTRAAARPWADVSVEWEGGPVVTELDRRRFANALGNVLANAAEHGAGDIRVTGRAHDGGVRLQVRNRGRGLRIAADAAEELGGSLTFEIVEDVAVATLDLPAA
ncbi:MAG TPA: ATP-binding protein [Thermoleophilaceae bacterium]|nr:ATP-binding protein [Thermoleophilaceae bacterium]